MKEQDVNTNQGNPELTRKPIQSTLKSGDIFMANEPGHGDGQPAPTEPTEAQIVPSEAAGTTRSIGRRGDLSRRDASRRAVIGPLGLEAVQIPLVDLQKDPDLEAEIMKLFEGQGALTKEQIEVRDKVKAAFQKGPRQFAKAVNDAIETLTPEGQQRLVELDFPDLLGAVMEEGRSLPPESQERLKLESITQGISEKSTAAEKLRALKRIRTSIKNEQIRLVKQPAAPVPEANIPTARDEEIQPAPPAAETAEQKILRQTWELASPIAKDASEIERKVREAVIDAAILRGFTPTDVPKSLEKLNKYLSKKQAGREGDLEEVPKEESLRRKAAEQVISIMTKDAEFTPAEKEVYKDRIKRINKIGDEQEFVREVRELVKEIDERKQQLMDEAIRREGIEEAGRLEAGLDSQQNQDDEESITGRKDVGNEFDRLLDVANQLGIDSGKDNGIREALIRDASVQRILVELTRSVPGQGIKMSEGVWVDPASFKELANAWRDIVKTPDIDVAKARIKQFVNEINFKIDEREREQSGDRIDNVQALARFIYTKQNGEIYAPGRKYELVDEQGNFRPDNFLIWVREQSVALHKDNRNGQMEPLSAVVIETTFRTISIYMMTRFREQYFKDQHTGEILNDLADRVLMEAFMFGVFRNNDIAYRSVMGEDKKLPEALPQFHAKNDLTHDDNLAVMYTSPGEMGKEGDMRVGEATMFANDFYYNISDREELLKVLEGSNITQQDFADALLIISGKNEWERDEVNFPRHFDPEDPYKYFYLNDKKQRVYFFLDENGQMQDTVNMDAFIDGLNIFNAATPKLTTANLLREIVRLKAAQKYGLSSGLITPGEAKAESVRLAREADRPDGWAELVGEESRKLEAQYPDPEQRMKTAEQNAAVVFKRARWESLVEDFNHKLRHEYPNEAERLAKAQKLANAEFKKERNADRTNLEYAETNSFVFQRPYGIAARNDTGRRGYDAATKLFAYDYILRQSGEGTGGPLGIPELMGIFRLLSPDMMEGLATETGESPRQLMLKVREIDLTDFTEAAKNSLDDEFKNDPAKLAEAIAKIRVEKKSEIIGTLRFNDRAEADYTSNQQSRAFQIFHSLTEGEDLDLHDVITHSFYEGIKVKLGKAEEIVKDRWMKPIRYLLSSNSALNFSAKARMMDFVKTRDSKAQETAAMKTVREARVAENVARRAQGQEALPEIGLAKPAPKYETVTLAEKMLSPDVTDREYTTIKVKENGVEREIGLLDAIKDPNIYETNKAEIRKYLAKNAITARIGFVIAFHRKLYGLGERWGYERVQALYHFLHRIKEYEPDPERPGRVLEGTKGFYSHHDMDWMRDLSGTKEGQMILQELSAQGGLGALEGGKDALLKFIQAILKT